MKEPFYHIKYTSGECLFKLYLNNILIIDNIDGSADRAGTQLLNFFIFRSGAQNLRFEIHPKEGEKFFSEHSFLEIALYVSDQATHFKEKKYLIKEGTVSPPEIFFGILENEDPSHEDIEDAHTQYGQQQGLANFYDKENPKNPPVFWNLTFKANVPFILDQSWKNAKKITRIQDYEEKVKAAYTQLFQVVQEGSAPKLFKLLESSLTRTGKCLFEDANEQDNNKSVIENLIKQQPVGGRKFYLQPLDLSTIRTYGNGKVVDVLRKDGNPVLFFKNKPGDRSGASINIRLYRPKNNAGGELQFKIL